MLGFSTLNAANENLPSIDNSVGDKPFASKLVLQEIEKNENLTLLSTEVLKQRRHQLRIRLMHRRSRSLAPPIGDYRCQLESTFAEIERVLKQKS